MKNLQHQSDQSEIIKQNNSISKTKMSCFTPTYDVAFFEALYATLAEQQTNVAEIRADCVRIMTTAAEMIGLANEKICATRIRATRTELYFPTKFSSKEIMDRSGLDTSMIKMKAPEKQKALVAFLKSEYKKLLTKIASGMAALNSYDQMNKYHMFIRYETAKITFLINTCGSMCESYVIQNDHKEYTIQQRRMEKIFLRRMMITLICGGVVIYPLLAVAYIAASCCSPCIALCILSKSDEKTADDDSLNYWVD